jgi:hypothetical protein
MYNYRAWPRVRATLVWGGLALLCVVAISLEAAAGWPGQSHRVTTVALGAVWAGRLAFRTADGAGAGSSPGGSLTMNLYGDDDDGPDCDHFGCMGEDECQRKDSDMGGML